ncbi:hypothetical protein [Actinocorallia aurantiaca]|uniref:ABC-type branched-subunit amino acid transport system substrate-binding protein n=1 Tax=Actinocorallia aurantiaca TaxID=46204 RepID=A0ABN3U5D1_9ACTN
MAWTVVGSVFLSVVIVMSVAYFLRPSEGCEGAPEGVRLNSAEHGECIGITDGGYLFTPVDGDLGGADRATATEIGEVQRKIEAENHRVAKTKNHVKVALLSPLTVSKSIPSTMSLQQIRDTLQGSYTALVRANRSSAFSDPAAVQIQLLLANQGSRQEAGTEFVDELMAVSEPDHPLVAVVGLGSSVANTEKVARDLAGRGVPMVSAVTSADTLTGIQGLWSVSPGNSQYAQALKTFLDRPDQEELRTGIIVHDLNEDPYTTTLKAAYQTVLGSYVRYPGQSYAGSTAEQPLAPNAFRPVINNLCEAMGRQKNPLDMVFFAGRLADFEVFAQYLDERICRDDPLTILVGATGFAGAEKYGDLLREANVTVVYATSSDSQSWDGKEKGTPRYYPDFRKAFLSHAFDAADLRDGYAIAHHDALATAATAIGLAAVPRKQDTAARLPTPQDVKAQFGRLNLANVVRAASGELSFEPAGGRAAGRSIPLRQVGSNSQVPELPEGLAPYVVPAP